MVVQSEAIPRMIKIICRYVRLSYPGTHSPLLVTFRVMSILFVLALSSILGALLPRASEPESHRTMNLGGID
jgi:hypothetical protein